MSATILIWVTRILTVLIVLVTILPFIPTGYWAVRLCDGPRMQFAIIASLLIPLVVLHWWLIADLKVEHIVLIIVLGGVSLWQVSHVAKYTPFWPPELPNTAGTEVPSLRMIVANLEKDNAQHDAAVETLRTHGGDLLLLIEINESWRSALTRLESQYPHRIEEVRDEGLGIALWSKFPLHDAEVKHLISDRRASIHASVELPDGHRVNFVGVHPTPPGLKDKTSGGRRNSRVRDAELVLIARKVKDRNDESWIIAGDFNDVAWSHTSRLFGRLSGLKDPRVGRGLYNTYHAKYPPLRFPIDQTYFSSGFRLKLLGRIRIPGSDHFAITTDVSFIGQSGTDPKPVRDDNEEAEEMVEEGVNDAENKNVDSD